MRSRASICRPRRSASGFWIGCWSPTGTAHEGDDDDAARRCRNAARAEHRERGTCADYSPRPKLSGPRTPATQTAMAVTARACRARMRPAAAPRRHRRPLLTPAGLAPYGCGTCARLAARDGAQPQERGSAPRQVAGSRCLPDGRWLRPRRVPRGSRPRPRERQAARADPRHQPDRWLADVNTWQAARTGRTARRWARSCGGTATGRSSGMCFSTRPRSSSWRALHSPATPSARSLTDPRAGPCPHNAPTAVSSRSGRR